LAGALVGSTAFTGTTVAGGHTFAAELDTVRDGTRPYRDVDVAKDDGDYVFFGVVPHAGVVYANPANIGNTGHSDDPALLFYAPSEDLTQGDPEDVVDETTLALAGIEYLVTPWSSDPATDPAIDTDIFDDERANRELKVSEEDGWHGFPIPPGDPGHMDVTGLHAWVHLANPNGIFAVNHPIMLERIDSEDD
jgi:hypothetical protein